MSKHSDHLEGYNGSLEELAKALGNMRYDKLVVFIEKLADGINRQADNDLARGRQRLARQLYDVAVNLHEARDSMYKAWKICQPYMSED